MNELKVDNIIIQVRDKLRKDGVKLWLSPYYLPTGPSTPELERLALEYSEALNIQYDFCYAAVSELQSITLDKLKQRDLYRSSGIATLKIKILIQNLPPKLTSHEISLKEMGQQLKYLVSQTTNIPEERLKLIANGKVILENKTLFEQGIQNGQQILALTLNQSLTDLHEIENRYQEIEDVKADTTLLASDDNDYMELEDQSGNPVKIPAHERKALMVALALHGKGKSALKREDYSRALVFFLDADKEFSQCNSDLLNCVDNYALLDLDIAWCYLCLESVSHLPEAYNRLKRCESVFEKSYGPNLERLIVVKGTPGNEAVLFLRLHLLQGIVLFHQNKRQEALQLFKQVERELQVLKVDESSIIILMELGYSAAEARLGLRVMHGDVNRAANYINENREKRMESRRKAHAEKILQREQEKLGKCIDGNQFVNASFLKILMDMGYNKETARSALKNCNNIISDSVQYIQENPGPSTSISNEMLSLIHGLIPELQAAGFDPNMAKQALQKCNGDVTKAVNTLLTNSGIVDGEDYDEDNSKSKEQKEKLEEAYVRLSEDMSMVDDEHLDLTLQQEELFLQQYISLLNPQL
ncbi:hypothetical protein RI129_007342 [Pyrocoelia pectoralis]|uniref:NEDD8 ultimate buster 1 n=1 Tax=Pyrocoelia pectoralis TaxID=417401 RepID=A0AAN7V9I2_9COLE